MKHIIIILIIVLMSLYSCEDGLQPSQHPGIIKVYLSSDPGDTTITILGDTLRTDEKSYFRLNVFESKAYIDSFYANLVVQPEDRIDGGNTYNMLEKRDSLSTYTQHKIYECYAPVGDYSLLQIGMTPSKVQIGGYLIPVGLSEGMSPIQDIPIDFYVSEFDTTEIELQIKPFKSIVREKDEFVFSRDIEIIRIENIAEDK